jgi:catechol 2,3-dioxygenase-like lactoylglutathione lyase family enzyme
VREYGRWHLTDFQRLLIVLAVVMSMFLGAVAWGWGRLDLALVALFLLVAVGLGVFMLGLRYSGRVLVPVMAEVLAASPPPRRGVVGRCEMHLLVDLPGRGFTKVKLRRQVDVTKWPRAGMRLPVQVSGRGRVEIRWQAFGSRHAPVAPAYEPDVDDIGPVPGYNAPIYTEYRAGAFEQDYAPTGGPGPTLSGAVVDDDVAAQSVPPPPGSAHSGEPYDDAAFDAYVDEHYRDDLDDPYLQEPYPFPPGTRPPRQRTDASMADDADTTLHTGRDDGPVDMRMYLPDRTDTRIDMAGPLAAPVEVKVDVDGEVDADGEERARAANFEVPRSGPPLPRRGDRPPAAAPGSPPTPVPEPAAGPEPAQASGGATISLMLVVADVERSVTFYRDRLGFTVDDQADGGAVLSNGAGQIVLQRLSDMAPVDRRVVVLRLTVPDVEAAYSRLRDQGVDFAQRPGWIRVGRRDLRAAKLHDPDGHAIQIVQDWRRSDGSARP